MKRLEFLVLLALVLALGAESFADHGEYKSPVAPPFGGPKKPGGLTRTPTWRRRLPTETTPPVEGRKPGEVTPGGTEEVPTGRRLTRRDDRFRWDLWWEMDRRLFLGERPVLGGAARAAALGALEASLKDANPVVRSHAQGALARAGHRQALAACLATLEDDASGGHGAVLALGILGGDSVIAPLKKVVTSEKRDLYARTLALAALGLTRSPAATSFLREVVDEEPRPNLRSAAVIALGLHRDVESVARLRALLVARARGSGLGDLDPLDDIVRCAAASALGHIGTEAGRAALLNAIEEGDGLAAGSAALALGRLNDPAARAALKMTVLSVRPFPARAMSIVALVRCADRTVREPLLKLLDDPAMSSTNLAGVAIAALGIVGEPDDAKRLADILANTDIPALNRAAAAAALGRLGARGGITPLKAILGRVKNPLLRGHVVLAMARLGAPGTDDAIQENIEKGRTPALKRLTVDALAQRGGEKGLKHLIEALRDEYYVNREAAREIARVDTNMALRAILARHEDPKNAGARTFAVDALGWLLTENSPAIDVARDLNLLSRMPLIQSLLSLGRADYLYDLVLDL
jgi:HEAT repeat protein